LSTPQQYEHDHRDDEQPLRKLTQLLERIFRFNFGRDVLSKPVDE
jgi:hypothetical protein